MNNANELKAGMLVALSMSRNANLYTVRHLSDEDGVMGFIELTQLSGNKVGCGYACYSALNHPSRYQLDNAIAELDALYDSMPELEGVEANHPTFPYYSALQYLRRKRQGLVSTLATA